MQTPGDMRAFNEHLIAEFRANGGKLSGQLANSHLLLLTTTGARKVRRSASIAGASGTA